MTLSQTRKTTYDYIIVGAGSAGAALAARLSEDPSTSVLLLEAGPDYRSRDTPPEMRSPNLWGLMMPEPFRQTYHWPGLKVRRTRAQAPSPYLAGRGVGGTSAINGMIVVRGMPEDYDRWAGLGCTGWSAKEVLPAFLRLEDDLNFGDKPYHGRGGPIPIYRAPLDQWGAVDLAVREAALDLGYGWSDDHNAPGSTGVSPHAMNLRGGLRVTTNDAYLEPARGRSNLHIAGGVLVDRVEFEGRRARGVRARVAGQWSHLQGGEVVLCAGALYSPAILMRSGIGPAADLQALGINVLMDSPGVGRNLLDHPGIPITLALRPEARAKSAHLPFTNSCVRYSSGVAGAGANDMLFLNCNMVGFDETALSTGLIVASVYHSFSRGRLRITTPSPDVDPEVDELMLSDARDLVRLRDAARRLFDIGRHPAVAAIAERVTLGSTGRGIEEFTDDAQLDTLLLSEPVMWYHAAGTCRMGPAGNPESVVDPDCRVIGVEGLRVVDASVMPEIPRANTYLTTVMIAEHMAARMQQGKS